MIKVANRLAVRSNSALFTAINAGDGGNGDMRYVVNKETRLRSSPRRSISRSSAPSSSPRRDPGTALRAAVRPLTLC
jgi:hypothetical protein